MTLAVVDWVEKWRPAATGTALPAVVCLVGLVRDGATDPASAQVGAVLAGGVRLVGPHAIRADAWPTRSDAGHADLFQHGFKLRRVSTLPCRHHDRHEFLTLLDGQVELGGEPAARPSQPVITGLGEDAARWFLLQVALLAGPGRVLMGAADRGVDAQVPDDRAFRVGQGLKPGEDPLPGAVALPPAEQVIDPAPGPVLGGDVPPRNSGPDPESYAVDQPPPRPDRRPPRLRPPRQQRLQHRPLLVREISPRHETRSFTAQDPLSIHDLIGGPSPEPGSAGVPGSAGRARPGATGRSSRTPPTRTAGHGAGSATDSPSGSGRRPRSRSPADHGPRIPGCRSRHPVLLPGRDHRLDQRPLLVR